MNIFLSFKKSNNLKKLYKDLYGKYHDLSMHEMYRTWQDGTSDIDEEIQNKALDNLLNLIENDISLKPILIKYNANNELLRKIYTQLCALGFKSYYGGHLLPAAAISYTVPLQYILENYDDFTSGKNQATIVNNVMLYFKNGKISKI